MTYTNFNDIKSDVMGGQTVYCRSSNFVVEYDEKVKDFIVRDKLTGAKTSLESEIWVEDFYSY